MRVEDEPLSYNQARGIFERDLAHYLAEGELLPTCGGLSGATDTALARVAGAVYDGVDNSDAVGAAWARSTSCARNSHYRVNPGRRRLRATRSGRGVGGLLQHSAVRLPGGP
jgi:hypothetical protein